MTKSIVSISSINSVNSLHLQYEFAIKCKWVLGDKNIIISGIVDYSLWFGQAGNLATNMAMVETK